MDEYGRNRLLAYERDRFCRLCGGQAMHCHHIRYRSEGIDNSLQNLIILCMDCHSMVHADKPKWKPALLAYIWSLYVDKRRLSPRQIRAYSE